MHLAVSIKVMHTGIYAIIVGRNPHVCILVHHAASSVEHVVVVANLGKALCSDVIREVICFAAYLDEAILHDVTIFVTPVGAVLQFAANGIAINIAAAVLIDLAHAASKDNSAIDLNCAVEHLAVFIAPVVLALVGHKAAAFADQQSGILIEVIPVIISMVVFLMGIVAMDDIAFAIYPVCSLIKNDPLACQPVLAEVVACTAIFVYECTSDQYAVVVKYELLTVHSGRAGECSIILGGEVVQICAVKSRAPAGIELAVDRVIQLAACRNDAGGHVATACAGHSALLQIAAIGMLVIGASFKMLSIGIDQFAVDVLGINSDAVRRGLDSHVHCAVAVVDLFKVVCRINGDIVALLTGRAADEVHYAVFIHDAIRHGLGAGIGVIMSGEHEVNACRLNRLRQIVMHEGVECLGIRSVCRYMHSKYLPAAGGCLSVLHQLFKGFLILAGTGVVNDSHINIAVFHGIEAAVTGSGQIIHCIGNLAIYIAVEFVVTQNMDKIHTVHGLRVEYIRQSVPIYIARAVVHSVAGLDSEIVARAVCRQRVEDLPNIFGVGGLGVTYNEEVGLAGLLVHREAEGLAPCLSVTDCVVVGDSLSKAIELDRADTSRFFREMYKCGRAGIFLILGRFILSGILCIQAQYGCILGYRYIGKPSYALASRGSIILDKPRCRSTVARNGVNDNTLIPRALHCTIIIAVSVGIDLTGLVQSDLHTAFIVSNGVRSDTIYMDINSGCCFPIFVLDMDLEGIAYNAIFRLNGIVRLYRHIDRREAEAIGERAGFHGSELAGSYTVAEVGSLRKTIGNVEGQQCYLPICRIRIFALCDVERQLACAGTVSIAAGEAVSELHNGLAESGIELSCYRCRLDICAVIGCQRQSVISSKIRCCALNRLERHVGVAGLRAVYGEVAYLVCLVAVIITDAYTQRVQAVCQMNIRQNHQIILRDDKSGMVDHVDAVDVSTDGVKVHARCELAVIVSKGCGKGDCIFAELGAAVLGYGLVGIVVVYGGDGGIDRILVVIAVDKLNIVQIYGAGSIAIGMLYKSLGNQANGVVAQHLKCAVALSFQTGSDIDPALSGHVAQRGGSHRFTVLIYICISIGQIDGFASRLNDALE